MSGNCLLFAIGNPLLDIQVKSEEILTKYELKSNDAILADAKHMPIYDEVTKNFDVTYVAGGAAQNAARGAAYVLPPNSVVYAGCVGDDDLAEQLKAANAKEGLKDLYLVKKGEQTGACVVVITGQDRSLVTTLRAAEKFEESHLSSPEVAPYIDSAKVFYIEGYFLTHGAAAVTNLAKQASAAGKITVLNFSAPFIAQFFQPQLQEILPYIDITICNEDEAEAFASGSGHADTKDLAAIAKAIATSSKSNAARPRTAIITHGAQSTVFVTADQADNAVTVPVQALAKEEIVDTNAAGDGFAGGFLGAIISDKSVREAVEVGHKLGAMVCGQVGPQYKWPKVNVL